MLKACGNRLKAKRCEHTPSILRFFLIRAIRTAATNAMSAAIDTQARNEICNSISGLKVAELNELMRGCGLTQGTVKAKKIEALGTFIWDAQRLALDRYRDNCTNMRSPQTPAKIHAFYVPNEVVSIDIGYKNLAFAHVSRTGRVLGWKRVELLKNATFEPWILAQVVDEYVRGILPIHSASKCTYLIEHQRFRSQGSAAVTNSIMINNLVEALLYANLRHASAQIQTINPALVTSEWEPRISESEPKAIAKIKAKSSLGRSKKNTNGSYEESQEKEKLVDTIAEMDKALFEQKQLSKVRHALLLSALGRPKPRVPSSAKSAVRNIDELMSREKGSLGTLRDLRRRLIKKERTIATVQGWIIASLASQGLGLKHTDSPDANAKLGVHAYLPDETNTSARPLISGTHVSFAPETAEMFCNEKKKDDLCDCLTQAVAWYQWQNYTVDVLDQYGSTLITSLK
ncbi:hypothetical protein GGI11_000991 [Coemansia sp. RSA 2049]|nr:hypothetical protein H4217_000397 [Coemansia sp. RSA 1939]KAJ2524197.1 hypothetical protein GGI11_000991 [Coemansia sp. RSA 2049]KAJ2616764.1 hypothetical protein EV177_000893 [Coemansia sp. RSA 1804]KAJ2689223.1 hypothetical protein GGH99_002873 [Coemansia sp. RSA 1285]